ncbi:YchJ family metal-binding protein [Stigmatella sp. ncwal1]|uniref:YchJ family metal-binding protein n=1 Tax=Stigmatella ashevillensis TaxID=2995309 RepID=A0ABT5DAM1_9BACT|nr:YchJ family metal-binding protein [Stigmatella ashevillena]MDC0710684.1 YchJ family metal-binding protein [Stigmatella ashevillena]
MPPAPVCPCTSGLRYRQCCAPYHRGEAEPPDAEALMRSRYSAFALREVGYLWKTLHPEHPDRSRPEADMLRELRTSAQSHQYPGLVVMDRSPPDAQGVAQVLFFAKVFERGKDRSFVELSDFRHDGTGWRYVSGVLRPLGELSGPPEQLTRATFPR